MLRHALNAFICTGMLLAANANAGENDEIAPQSEPTRYVTPESQEGSFYQQQVKPIMERRCVVCHACYDAPCQLKLGSPDGIDRGLHPSKVYNGTRILAAEPTRLFEDAQTAREWRSKGFHPILPPADAGQDEIEQSLLFRVLALKQRHPNPDSPILPASFDFKLDRNQQCVSADNYHRVEQKRPLWGMPYGLPGLTAREFDTLGRWLNQGAPLPDVPLLSANTRALRHHWERFLNQDSFRHRLVSRYIYEHLYLFNLYFEQQPQAGYFKLVRSSTPPGEPVKRIATRRPFDDPGVERVFYRLVAERSAVVAKNHIPYPLGPARQRRWQELFFSSDYRVEQLPGYEPELAANPFLTFRALPPRARYRFMLDDAQDTIMAFIKGPVCRGQMAVNVINEHFWVYFFDPEFRISDDTRELVQKSLHQLTLPAAASSNALPISTWLKYASLQDEYLQTKATILNRELGKKTPIDENLIWDGDGHNSNAALTIFRHFDNAAVVKGLVGAPPKTAWVIDYPLLERIHYLLVAGFDVYGNLGHQLVTRLYMDFLRMEGELNFLMLLPKDARNRERDYWYRDSGAGIQSYIFGRHSNIHPQPAINYQTAEPKQELYQRLRRRLQPILETRYELSSSTLSAESQQLLQRVEQLQGNGLRFLPEYSLILVRTHSGDEQLVSMVHHRAHANISSLFDEANALRPDEDSLTFTTGVVGDHPNLLLWIAEGQLPQMVNRMTGLQTEEDYAKFVGRYGIRRSDVRFWQVSDRIIDRYQANSPIEAGLLDYNRLENR
ncbi:fatty acid cis/trans isomerase [Motiliproteus sediminis]|uniref:fatty acid cis/trans isomerase n=1 Tax=Motiliproteus sediminis TaxID=1468178 RepID=UPI001AEF9C9A|nr:fatty acid cis/trans isomerase [Motiliproteus sediminis]